MKCNSVIIKREFDFNKSRVNKYKLIFTIKCQECSKEFIDKKLFKTEEAICKYEEECQYNPSLYLCHDCHYKRYNNVKFTIACSQCGKTYSFKRTFKDENELLGFNNWFKTLSNPFCKGCRDLRCTSSSEDEENDLNSMLISLHATIGTGEIVKIRYNGGSQPGTIREIVPKELKDGYLQKYEYLRAYCYATSAIKIFKTELIELCDPSMEVTYKYLDAKSST